MSRPKEALKLALEALQFSGNIWHMDCKKDEAIAAIKQVLAQLEQELDVLAHAKPTQAQLAYLPPSPGFYAPPQLERNFCPRCGKRTADLTVIHTCTPPQEKNT
jgi:hypothetical protein